MTDTIVVEKEMGITHREFLRLVARFFADADYSVDGGQIVQEADGRRIEIALSPESVRRIAFIELPVTQVRLAFTGYDEEAAAAALAFFDRTFQRGGG
jgi:hypothetical protein